MKGSNNVGVLAIQHPDFLKTTIGISFHVFQNCSVWGSLGGLPKKQMKVDFSFLVSAVCSIDLSESEQDV